jgi:hypothetical protein
MHFIGSRGDEGGGTYERAASAGAGGSSGGGPADSPGDLSDDDIPF